MKYRVIYEYEVEANSWIEAISEPTLLRLASVDATVMKEDNN